MDKVKIIQRRRKAKLDAEPMTTGGNSGTPDPTQQRTDSLQVDDVKINKDPIIIDKMSQPDGLAPVNEDEVEDAADKALQSVLNEDKKVKDEKLKRYKKDLIKFLWKKLLGPSNPGDGLPTGQEFVNPTEYKGPSGDSLNDGSASQSGQGDMGGVNTPAPPKEIEKPKKDDGSGVGKAGKKDDGAGIFPETKITIGGKELKVPQPIKVKGDRIRGPREEYYDDRRFFY